MSDPQSDLHHVVGNALFALETNLEVLRGRCKDIPRCLEVVEAMFPSIDKIKDYLHRCKDTPNEERS